MLTYLLLNVFYTSSLDSKVRQGTCSQRGPEKQINTENENTEKKTKFFKTHFRELKKLDKILGSILYI